MALTATWRDSSARTGARKRAFTAARRHSRRVRALRFLLPVAGVLAVAAFAAKTHFSFPGMADLTSAGLSVTRNSIIMDRPRLTGFAGDKREYTVAADRAIQPLASPGEVRLESLQATLTSATGGVTTISADSGDYDHTNNTLRLFGTIEVNSAEGYKLTMTDADIDFEAETMVTENPVKIGYEDSEITGDRMSATDGGQRIVVEGGVRTVVNRAATAAAPTQ